MADYLDANLLTMEIPKIKPLQLSREWNRLLTSGGRGRKAGKPLSRKTMLNIAGLVSSAYMRAIRWGIAEVNPVPGSEPPVPQKKEGIALTAKQQEHLISKATAALGMDVFLELDAAPGARLSGRDGQTSASDSVGSGSLGFAPEPRRGSRPACDDALRGNLRIEEGEHLK